MITALRASKKKADLTIVDEAHLIATEESSEEYDIHSVIAFLNRVQRAKDFSRPGGESSIQTVTEATGWLDRLKKKGAIKSVEASHVDGTMRASDREERLKDLKFAHKEGKLIVIANCSCLGVGIDVPLLDAGINDRPTQK